MKLWMAILIELIALALVAALVLGLRWAYENVSHVGAIIVGTIVLVLVAAAGLYSQANG